MYLCNWVFCIQVNKTLLQCQKLTDQSIKSITHFFLLIYLTFLHLSYVLCLFWLHITAHMKAQLLCFCFLNCRQKGRWQTMGKRKPWNLPPRWYFTFHVYFFKEIKEEIKMSCFISQGADIFNLSAPPKAWTNQVTTRGVVSISRPALPWFPNRCQNSPAGLELHPFTTMAEMVSAFPF